MNTQIMNPQLQTYRNQAAQLVEQLVPAISGSKVTTQDGIVDDVLRSLGGQAPRPTGRQPYDGFFPGLPISEQRRRAASGLKVFIEQLPSPQASEKDIQVDRLIRTLRGLPPLPANQPAYEALFNPFSSIEPDVPDTQPFPSVTSAQLQAWRTNATKVLASLIPAIASTSPTSQDGLADDLLRSLGGQAPRPPERIPYEGFFPNLPISEQRRRIATGLAPFIERLTPTRYVPQDELIDNLIRALRGLPARPENQRFYEGLFDPIASSPPPSSAQIAQWRDEAARWLTTLIPRIAGNPANTQDSAVDNLLRVLGGQATRPIGQQPYNGFFPNLSLTDQRRRAAQGIQVFIERLSGGLSSKDAAIDDTLRVLRNLPNRPSERRPYEGLFGTEPTSATGQILPPVSSGQLQAWRQDAGRILGELVPKISGANPTVQDNSVDSLLRLLSNQTERPSDRPPYVGFFPNVPLIEQRRRAAQGLRTFINVLNTPNYVIADSQIDDLIRSLRGLPPRPEGRRPYEGLLPSLPQLPAGLDITEQQLKAIAPFGATSQIRKFVPQLNRTMAEFGINTRLRQAHFLAQVAHESGEFNFVEEIASGDAYEGRADLGNTQPGDGRRYKGRGLIQITGRANYADASRALGVDVISNPTLLSTDALAARSAGWFWQKSGLNAIADQDDVVRVTRVINGGTNGLSDRTQKLAAAKRVFGL